MMGPRPHRSESEPALARTETSMIAATVKKAPGFPTSRTRPSNGRKVTRLPWLTVRAPMTAAGKTALRVRSVPSRREKGMRAGFPVSRRAPPTTTQVKATPAAKRKRGLKEKCRITASEISGPRARPRLLPMP